MNCAPPFTCRRTPCLRLSIPKSTPPARAKDIATLDAELLSVLVIESEEESELYTGRAGLVSMLRPADDGTVSVRLLRASWLAKQGYAKRGKIPRRQVLEATEPEAFASAELVSSCLDDMVHAAEDDSTFMKYPGVLVLSYCWETPEHPDLHGANLRQLAPFLEWYLSERVNMKSEDGIPAEKQTLNMYDCCIFVDFWSMYQGVDPEQSGDASTEEIPRLTQVQHAAFVRALYRMDEWYAHMGTVVLLMTCVPDEWTDFRAAGKSYSSRGWCTFEHRVMSLAKLPVHCLDVGKCKAFFEEKEEGLIASTPLVESESMDAVALGAQSQGNSYAMDEGILGLASSGRPSPITPAAFSQLIGTKQFTVPADRLIVGGLYKKVAERVLGSMQLLTFEALLSWTSEDFANLGGALELCSELKCLSLNVMAMQDESLSSLCSALSLHSLHSLQKLTELALIGNQIGEKGLAALVGLLSQGALPNLENLHLSENKLGDAGIRALTEGLTMTIVPKLRTLDLSDNTISPSSALRLLSVLASDTGLLPSLKTLDLSKNLISVQHGKELRAVLRNKGLHLNVLLDSTASPRCRSCVLM